MTSVSDLYGAAFAAQLEEQASLTPVPGSGSLVRKFGQVPISVLSSAGASWQRRRATLEKEFPFAKPLGRENAKVPIGYIKILSNLKIPVSGKLAEAVSMFDPVLTECSYLWWADWDNPTVLDPFAGGPVRGIMAALYGLAYTGIDISLEQVEANHKAWADVKPRFPAAPDPQWLHGDSSRDLPLLIPGQQYGFLLTCPPYFDFETYTDDPRDLSNVPWPEFVQLYHQAMTSAYTFLSPGAKACVVIGDMRDSQGDLRGIPFLTQQTAFQAGMTLYNDGIYQTPTGTGAQRASYQFEIGRKLIKVHQYLTVFRKP